MFKMVVWIIVILTFSIIFLVLAGIAGTTTSGLLIPLEDHSLVGPKETTPSADPRCLSDFAFEPILTPEEIERAHKQILADKSKWVHRSGPMYTLGVPSYIEGAQNRQGYVKKAKDMNPEMMQKYGWLLEKVQDYFQKRSPNARVTFRDRAALPGFHIFESNSIFALPVASVHKDLQHQFLQTNKQEKLDLVNTLSFTLTIALPQTGGGLYMFEVDPAYDLYPPIVQLRKAKKKRINYKAGWMVAHNGNDWHMIAPSADPKTRSERGKYRITLQGHGVYDIKTMTWYLYW
jgi:hypothetical protein